MSTNDYDSKNKNPFDKLLGKPSEALNNLASSRATRAGENLSKVSNNEESLVISVISYAEKFRDSYLLTNEAEAPSEKEMEEFKVLDTYLRTGTLHFKNAGGHKPQCCLTQNDFNTLGKHFRQKIKPF